MPVRAWMRREVVTAPSDTPLGAAAELMRTREMRHLPITDRHGRLVGIVTDRDLRQVLFDPRVLERVRAAATALGELTVADVMTWGVVTVRPTADLREAARLMHGRKIGALPVVDGDRVVGILTESDVLRAFEQVLRSHVTRPRPLLGVSAGGRYDYGFPVPEQDAWQDNGEP
jgi:acetoin utilization protein AcuB